jgi:flagellar basal-body rod protein FlgF
MQPSNLILLSGQMALSQAMDVVANNVANASTTGFKREGIEFDALLSSPSPDKPALHFVVDRATYRDTSSGPITTTNNPLDIAIHGSGYFQVQQPDGSMAYTRAGSFQLNPDGQIVTLSGLPLMGDGGQAITLPNTVSELNISGDGFITARTDNGKDLAQLGKLSVVQFDNDQQMQSAGNGLYTTSQSPQTATNSSFVQGAVEQSNVQPVTEITTMIRIMRSYEQVTNMISMENARHSNALDKLVSTSA